MARQIIDTTTPQPNGKIGDTAKVAFGKVNDNFAELYDAVANIPEDVTGDIEALDVRVTANEGAITALGADVQAQIDALAAGQAAGQKVYRTWAELSGVTGSAGEGAQVIDDTGTHTDPVTSATVPNQGQYVWSDSPAGWRWVREDAIAVMSPEVRRLGDSVQEASWPGVMTAMVGADGRRTWLEADDANGYPTEWSKEVLARALGYRMKYTPGLMFAVHDASGRLTEVCVRESDGKFPDFVVKSLAQRLPAYIDIGGRPKTAHNNIAALRKTRMKLAKLRAGDAGTQLDLCFIGDSYTAGHLFYLNKLTAALAAEYGFAGPGFIGFNHGAALGDTNFQYTRNSTTYFGGDWTVSNLGTASPDNRTVTGAAGAYIVINAIETSGISTVVTTARLLYLGNGASHVVRYRWGDELPWNELTLTGTGAAAVDFPVLPAGTGWRFRMEVVSGNPTLFGVWLGNSANGVRVSKMAASGSASGDWYKPDNPEWMAQWKASVSLIPADAYFIMLGGNDQSAGVAPETYLANIKGLVETLREINPSADIHLCVRQDTNRVSSVSMASYAKALGDWAWDNMIPFSDMQYAFGPDPNDYAHDGPLPLIDTDRTHPISSSGGRLITEFFRRIINAAQ